MIVGSTLIHDGTGTTPYYTPPLERGGQAATFLLDVTHLKAATTLTLIATVEHKNHDDATWGTAAAFNDITATGMASKELTSLKEQIRIAFTFSAGAFGDLVHLNMAQPAWRTYD